MKFQFLGKLRNGDDGPQGGSGGAPSRDIPTQEVQNLTDQGYSESEITEELRNRGYAYSEINEAMNAAVKQSASQRGGRGGGNNMQQPQQQQPPQDDFGGGDEFGGEDNWEPQNSSSFDDFDEEPQQPQEPAPQGGGGYQDDFGAPAQEPAPQGGGGGGATQITPEEEELIEIIVSEHVADLEDEFGQLRTDMSELREEFDELRQSFREIDVRKDEDEKVVIQKVNEMEEYFEQTHSRMGGMEKALQQVLPSLVENVRELSSIVREMQEEERA